MRYKVDEQQGGLDITVDEVGNDKQKLLEAFRECQEGRCTCPTDEYKKLDALEITQQGDGLQLHLRTRAGETLDKAEIEKCLGHTAQRVKS